MASNVPQWTQHYLGQPMTAEQFRYNPGAQEAVFDARMRDVLQHYSPQDAASIWFTGRPLGQGGAAAMDINGMTGQRYADLATRGVPNRTSTEQVAAAQPQIQTPQTPAPDAPAL